jgi:hypothetical protein
VFVNGSFTLSKETSKDPVVAVVIANEVVSADTSSIESQITPFTSVVPPSVQPVSVPIRPSGLMKSRNGSATTNQGLASVKTFEVP